MPHSEVDQPMLVVDHGQGDHERVTLAKDSIVIGRGEECDVVVADREVSRQHVRIYQQDSAFFVQDLDSKNGTWVNKEQIKGTRRLIDGDIIEMAMTVRVQFIGSNATAPLPFKVPLNIGEHSRLRLDKGARRVFVGEVEIDPPLSLPQYRLLELLFNSVGRICTRDAVVEAVWPEAMGEGVSEQAIDALVRRLRDRLAEIDPDWQYIVTVRGHGFRLDNPPPTNA